jgi:hypothetical protein
VTCVTNSAGQPVCSGADGFFAGLGILLFVYLVFAVVGLIAAIKVITKAGYSGWWILITFIPFVGFVFMLIFAFSKWPVTREVEMLRARLGGVGAGGYGRPGGYGAGPAFGSPGPTAPPSGPMVPTASMVPTESKVPTESTFEHTPIPTFDQFLQGGAPAVGSSPTDPTVASAESTDHPPAGWFPAPGGLPGQQRYWDGSNWTDHFS